MKILKTLTLVFITLIYIACNKDENKDQTQEEIVGKWNLQQSNYLITPKKEIIVYDFFGMPWTGEIKVTENGNEISETSFTFFKDNVFGAFHWSANKLTITQAGNDYMIGYNQKDYMLITSYEQQELHALKLNGTAFTETNENLEISGTITASSIIVNEGKQISVKDGYEFEKMNPMWLAFKQNGELIGEILEIDIVHQISGTWELIDNELKLSYKTMYYSTIFTKTYLVDQYQDNLTLYEQLDEQSTLYCDQLNVQVGDLSELKYEMQFQKE